MIEGTKPILECGALAHDFLRGFHVIPKVWVPGLGVQLGKAAGGGINVKDASLAIPSIA
jgi:hypothetical protein